MKKLFCLFLALALLVSLVPTVLAEDIVIVDPEDTAGAEALDAPEEDGLLPLTDAPEPLPAEERPGAESLFPAGHGAEKTWIADESNDGKGDCGNGVHWKLEGSTLTISGEGTMWDFTQYAPGWYGSRSSIKTIIIRSGPKNIGVNAFIDCQNVTSVSLSGSVTQIGNWAFEGCSALKSITLTKHVEAIGSGAFAYDAALTRIDVEAGNTVFKSVDGALYSIDGSVLHTYPAGKGGAVTLPNELLAVFDEAFEGCDTLTKLSCGDELVYFGTAACYGCTALRSVRFGNKLLQIGAGAFYGCIRLPGLSIPEGVQAIGDYAFYGCLSLPSLELPDSVQELGAYVCTDCTALERVTIGRSVKTIGAHAFENCPLESIVIPDSVTLIDDWAFAGCGELKSAVIGNGVKTIGTRAFDACVKMTDLTLGSSIKAIGRNAFYACKRVQAVELPDSLTTLRYEAFAGCARVKKLRLPASLTTIEFGALPGSAYLKTAGPLGSGCDVEFGWTEAIPDNGLRGPGLQSVILPEGLTSLGKQVLYYCEELEHINLPASLTSIGEECFRGCKKLTSAGPIGSGCAIEYGWTEEIPDSAFRYCPLETVIFPESMKKLGNYAFSNTGMSSVVIPDSVETVGSYCFSGCGRYEIVVGKNVSYIGQSAFTPYTNGAHTSIRFLGPAPETEGTAFSIIPDAALYPVDDETWTEEARDRIGSGWPWEPCLELEGPSPFAAEMSTAGMLLAWEPIEGAEEYELQQYSARQWKTLAVTAETSFFFLEAQVNVQYSDYDHYRVRARIGEVWSSYGLSVKLVFNPFSDVPSTGKTYDYVAWAYYKGIIRGTTETTFSPNDPCTRLQFVMMLWKMVGSPKWEGENPFRDVKGAKSSQAVVWALKRGIINESDRFYPDENISRIQIVMILWKFSGDTIGGGDCPFDDVQGAKARKAVAWAYAIGLTKGTSDTTFSPDADCTRVQLVVFLYKYVETHPYLR